MRLDVGAGMSIFKIKNLGEDLKCRKIVFLSHPEVGKMTTFDL
jgi:hypothetical protein